MASNGAAPTGGDYTLVRYEDGTESLAPARMGDLVAFELEHDRPADTNRLTDVLWMVHRSLGKPDGDLQTWADRVSGIVTDEAAIAEARARTPDPTPSPVAGEG